MRCRMILMLMPLMLLLGCKPEVAPEPPVVEVVSYIDRTVFVEVEPESAFDAETAMDCVVHIKAEKETAVMYDEYLRAQSGQSWQGSGCFISNDGVILTAGHVVDGASSIIVTLRDGIELEAVHFWKADNMDVGFIKVDVTNVPFLEFDVGGVNLAEDVFILGHPFGIANKWSITKGIISNTDRDRQGYFGEKLMLQSDAASWPGNSGGPVLNKTGRIVGVLVGGIGGHECLSYIVPSWIAKEWSDVFYEWLQTR